MIIVVAAILVLAGLWYMLGTDGSPSNPAQPANSQLVPSNVGPKGSSSQSNQKEGSQDVDGPRGDATPMRDSDGRIIPSSVPEGGTKLPMPGVAVDLGHSPTKQDIQTAERHQAMAKISGELGNAAAHRSETAVLPATMVAAEDEALGIKPERGVDSAPAGMVRSVPLDLPDVKIGPLSLRLAAAHGDPSAEFEVGARFAEGKGVPQNFKEAAKWYQNSADKGFAQAEYRLGTLYERGLGVKTDRSRAAAWYQRAAEQGNVKAMHNLAVLSADQTDDSPDYVTAAHWFEEAAKHGLPESQFNLAVLYENGLGVKADMTRAFMWLSLAAHTGDKDAVHRLSILRGKLTADQIASAEKMADNWKPLPANRVINNALVAGELWKKNPKNGVSG
jgi:localization factor PodJL